MVAMYAAFTPVPATSFEDPPARSDVELFEHQGDDRGLGGRADLGAGAVRLGVGRVVGVGGLQGKPGRKCSLGTARKAVSTSVVVMAFWSIRRSVSASRRCRGLGVAVSLLSVVMSATLVVVGMASCEDAEPSADWKTASNALAVMAAW